MNKTFLLIWIILQFALLLVGWGWVFVDRKNIFMFFFVPKI